jgi:long-chain fatty acid transport protein
MVMGSASLRLLSTLVPLAAVVFCAQPAFAGGFYVSEVGTPGSLGTAGVANPTNNFGADSAWTNPAGMTGLEQDTIVSGLQFIVPWVEFDPEIAEAGGSDGGNAGVVTPAPSFFGVKVISDRLRLGLGVNGMLGGGVDYGDQFVGRYSVNKAILTGIGLSPSFGYRVNDRLSLGAGVSVIYTILDEEISIRQPGRADGQASFDKIDDIGFQGFFGLQYALSERALLGVVYRTESEVDLSGDLVFSGLAIPFSPAGSIDVGWDNPQLLNIGLRYQLDDHLSLVANVDWEDWSAFSKNQLAISVGPIGAAGAIDRNWKDTYHGGIGLLYRGGLHNFSVGVSYDSSPVDDADRTFDLPVDEQFKLSAGYFRDREKGADVALGMTLMYAGESAIDQTSQGVRAKGEFGTNLLLFVGATLRHQF